MQDKGDTRVRGVRGGEDIKKKGGEGTWMEDTGRVGVEEGMRRRSGAVRGPKKAESGKGLDDKCVKNESRSKGIDKKA